MRRFPGWSLAWLLLVVLLAGCNPKSGADIDAKTLADAESLIDQSAKAKSKRKENTVIPIRTEVKGLAGRWAFVITQPTPQSGKSQISDLYHWIFTFEETSEGGWSGTVGGLEEKETPPVFDSIELKDDELKLVLHVGEEKLMYYGKMGEGSVRGTFIFRETSLSPARMIPTTAESFEGVERQQPTDGLAILSQVAADPKNGFRASWAFVKEYRDLPLALLAVQGLAGVRNREATLTAEEKQQVLEDYYDVTGRWGRMMAMKARFDLATGLLQQQADPEEASRLLEEAWGMLGERQDALKDQFNAFREAASVQLSLKKAKSDDPAVRTAARQELLDWRAKQPFNVNILSALAEFAVADKQDDAAIEYLTELTAGPLMEAQWVQMRNGLPPTEGLPSQQLEERWKAKHGNIDGLESHILARHRAMLAEALAEGVKSAGEPPAAVEKPRRVLVEFFTGGVCPPCVAVDVAMQHVGSVYAKDRVVSLTYHEHIPGPDPLATQASEDRFSAYQLQGTPSVVINGAFRSTIAAGPLQVSSPAYESLRRLIDPLATATTDVTIDAKATFAEGMIRVKVETSGISSEDLPNCRLLMALAEDSVAVAMPNGIREHHHVVRDLVGGAKGVGATDGQLKYEIELPATEVRQYIVDYLNAFEAGRNFKFDQRPLALKKLSLVAWLQNQSTREVLQAVSIPVEGEIAFPDAAAK